MSTSDRDVLDQALRHHFPAFIHRCFQTVAPGTTYMPNWHINAIAWHLERCWTGDIKRLIITVPPRSGKSICASVAFPAWILGHDPTRQIINVSYATNLTVDLTRQFRLVAEASWYQRAFPNTRPLKETESEFVTTRGGMRYATTVGGTLTGRGASVIIVDDPIKPADAMSKTARDNCINWFKSTLMTRLNDKKNDVIILIMQRLHEDDLVGHLLDEDPDGWHHLDLPVIAIEAQDVPIGDGIVHPRDVGDLLHAAREDQAVLDRIKTAMGSAAFSAQYQQRPVPEDGNMVKRDWFKSYETLPARAPGDRVIQSWDTALKAGQRNDPSVCTTWLENNSNYYLIDVYRKRVEFPDLRRDAIELYQEYQPDLVLIEDIGSGASLLQELKHIGGINATGRKPEGDKTMRLNGQTAKIEAGRVHLPEDARWLADFLQEVLAFPSGRHDDQVDSISQFLSWAAQDSHFAYWFIDPYEDEVPSPDTLLAYRQALM